MIEIKVKNPGAELTSIKFNGKERLHNGKTFWNRQVPILFPTVGRLKDNKTILCGCSKGMFCFYDMKTQQYKIENNYHSDDINCLLVLDDNRIISSSSDKTMKVWTY